MALVVNAPVAYLRRDGGGEPIAVERGHGLPEGVDEKHVTLLIARGVLGHDTAGVRGGEFNPVVGGSIEATLAWVGDDVDRATEVLVLEAGQDTTRSTLVTKLEAIVDRLTNPPTGDSDGA